MFAFYFRLKVLKQMLEDVSCGYWGCGGVVIRVQGNTLSSIQPEVRLVKCAGVLASSRKRKIVTLGFAEIM